MRKLKYSYANNRFSKKWTNKMIDFSELCEQFRNPVRTSETMEEYHKMPKKQQDDIKDIGGIVPGHLKDGRRKGENVICCSMIKLDADKVKPDFLANFENINTFAAVVYSTHSHTPEAPRLRIFVPTTRDMSPEETSAVTRFFADMFGIDQFDECSYRPHQLMYKPSAPSNGEYIFKVYNGKWLDPDEILAAHPNWRDITTLPTSSRESAVIKHEMKHQQDPLEKHGVVGAFCRSYDPVSVIEKFLQEVYEPSVVDGRYDYTPADSTAGVVIYEDKWIYSNHASDPAYGKLLNAFDLVRTHNFGDLDEKASYKAMSELAVADELVSAELLAERRQKAERVFAEGEDWENALQRNKSGQLINNLYNITLILENDPKLHGLVFNELADGMEVKGSVPWKRPAGVKFWRDADDAQLIRYIDSNYGAFSKQNYLTAVTAVVDDRSFHPIRDYLDSLPIWDGASRVDAVFIDYFGAEDTPYVRAVTRKTFCAAVKRVQQPGIKFDHMLVMEDKQGTGKSTLLSKLGGEWYSDSLSLSDLQDSKTAAEKLQGQWLLEISELTGIHKADVDRVKAFISRQDDKYRAAFGRRVTPHPRQCVIFGTVNPDKGYLRDITGNRRFWPVRLLGNAPKSSFDLTDDEVSQIWAEALVLAETENLYLDRDMEMLAKEEQRLSMEQDDREGLVRDYLEILLPDNWGKMSIHDRRIYLDEYDPDNPKGAIRRETICNLEIWCECFGKRREDFLPKDINSISAIMARIEGWVRQPNTKHHRHYGNQRCYERC